jgi:hypothetical protein
MPVKMTKDESVDLIRRLSNRGALYLEGSGRPVHVCCLRLSRRPEGDGIIGVDWVGEQCEVIIAGRNEEQLSLHVLNMLGEDFPVTILRVRWGKYGWEAV